MPMNPRILRPLARPLLLDAVPGAAAAYSLRQLSNSYTGPVVTVRRSSDNAEQDFKASEIDDGTLAAFCGAGDGFVKTWFDQSGNTGMDASQGAAASQPKIVESGLLVTEGGKAALDFDGTDDRLTVPSSTATFSFMHKSSSATFAVLKYSESDPAPALSMLMANSVASTDTGIFLFFDNRGAANNALGVVVNRGVSSSLAVLSIVSNVLLPTEQQLVSILLDPANVNASERLAHYFDGAFIDDANTLTNSPPSAANATYDMMIGSYPPGTSSFINGTISELLFYPSDQSANRQRIEGDINRHFGIF